MSSTVYIGLAVTSHNNGLLSTATFDNLKGSGFGAPAPAVLAGGDLTLDAGKTASLSGTAPNSSSVLWQKVTGPGTITFASPSSLSTTVTATEPGQYRIRLLSNDSNPQTFDDLLLNVRSAWETWQNTQFPTDPTGVTSQPLADPDGDGWCNLLEFAQGENPNTKSTTGMGIESSNATNGPQFTFRRRRGIGTGTTEAGYTVDGITYTLKASPSLSSTSWQTGSNVIQQVGTPVDNGDGTETVTVQLLGNNQSCFLKMEISLQ
jgi:hypothetical protein